MPLVPLRSKSIAPFAAIMLTGWFGHPMSTNTSATIRRPMRGSYTVAVIRRSTVVGHVPRRTSDACALFLDREGTNACTFNGSRWFSADLPQGGLEVPCTLKFQEPPKHVAKIKELVAPDAKKPSSTDHDIKTSMGGEQHNKKRKITTDSWCGWSAAHRSHLN